MAAETAKLVAGTPDISTAVPLRRDVPVSIARRMGIPSTTAELLRKAAAELIATMLFVLVGCLVCRDGNLMTIAWTHGCMIACLVIAFGPVSGGHINPAVTLAILLCGKIPVLDGIAYITSQLLGAVIGAFMAWSAMRDPAYMMINGGAHSPTIAASTEFQCFLLEIYVTFMLVLIILVSAVDQADNLLAPLAIGLTVFGGIAAAGSLSGGSLNPARSFGPMVVYAAAYHDTSSYNEACEKPGICLLPSDIWRHAHLYLAAPFVGGMLAAAVYRFVFYGKNKDA